LFERLKPARISAADEKAADHKPMDDRKQADVV
jgi:hypothetical protein